ncbi:hypothetical protein [Streptomyces sp. NBC_00268]|uniref:hypothetical protein n=1 Tax=Streptomyces sp. NBC_00268 TaxID=2975695 RepID=UPI0022591C7B|nr:hypothetical protein [Streptomyces sp. NBC_00268]MCX5191749.1 hypothetical protein [Streptomyces sp. NBC_00268]
MRYKPAIAIVFTVLLAALSSGNAIAAPTGTQALECLENWSVSNGQGRAAGKWCFNNGAGNAVAVRGTVTDTNADGRCPFVRVYINGGSYRDSDWAGPKGDSSPVTVNAPSGYYFTRLELKYISC